MDERERAARHIWEKTAELARLARAHGLDTLGYLLDMARAEARQALGLGFDPAQEQ